MTQATLFLALWVGSFLTLCAAVALASVFFKWAEYDLTLKGKGTEACVAAFASVFEAAGLWVVISVLPGVFRVLFFPALFVYFIYHIAHLSDWSGHESGIILLIQVVIGICGMELLKGEFGTAATVLVAFAIVMTVAGSVIKNLS